MRNKTQTTQKNKGEIMRSFNNNRGFGIELEITSNKGKTHVANAVTNRLRQVNPDYVCVEESYNHTTRNYWKIVGDASLRGTRGCPNTMEIVSPILKGDDGKQQLFAVLDALNNTYGLEVKVNKSCGVHVHHDLTNWRESRRADFANNMNNLISLVAKYEHAIYRLLPESRQRGYCNPVRNQYTNYNRFDQSSYKARIKTLKRSHQNRSVGNIQGGRYSGLNFQNLFTRGSVEYRYHQGSTNFSKLWNWIVFTQAFIETAEIKKSISYTEALTRASVNVALTRLRRDLGLYKCENDNELQNCNEEIKRRYHLYKHINVRRNSITQAQ